MRNELRIEYESSAHFMSASKPFGPHVEYGISTRMPVPVDSLNSLTPYEKR